MIYTKANTLATTTTLKELCQHFSSWIPITTSSLLPYLYFCRKHFLAGFSLNTVLSPKFLDTRA